MLVKFNSSESGELLAFAETARTILTICGKECTAQGVFTQDEMMPAVAKLRAAVEREQAEKNNKDAEDREENDKNKPIPVGLAQRAWPFIKALERTAKSKKEAFIVWQADKDFF